MIDEFGLDISFENVYVSETVDLRRRTDHFGQAVILLVCLQSREN